MKYTDVYDNMIRDGVNFDSFDTWGSEEDAIKFHVLLEKANTTTKHNGYIFKCVMKKGGGAGMGSHPDRLLVYVLHDFGDK